MNHAYQVHIAIFAIRHRERSGSIVVVVVLQAESVDGVAALAAAQEQAHARPRARPAHGGQRRRGRRLRQQHAHHAQGAYYFPPSFSSIKLTFSFFLNPYVLLQYLDCLLICRNFRTLPLPTRRRRPPPCRRRRPRCRGRGSQCNTPSRRTTAAKTAESPP